MQRFVLKRYPVTIKHIRILVADDHPVVAVAVTQQLNRHPGFSAYAPVANSTELFERLSVIEVDVLVADYAMPGGDFGDGLTMLKRVRDKYPHICIVVFTALNRLGIVAALEFNGINSIINKADDVNELIVAIDRALRGDGYLGRSIREIGRQSKVFCKRGLVALSRREAEVLRLYLAGHSVSEIAAALKRSAKTIYNQKRAAMAKLLCKTDAELFSLQAVGGIAREFNTVELVEAEDSSKSVSNNLRLKMVALTDAELDRCAIAIQASDAEEIASLAHRMRGSFLVIAMPHLVALCAQLEIAASTGNIDRAPLLLTEIQQEWEGLRHTFDYPYENRQNDSIPPDTLAK
ncbi:response regulator [Glaciimonas sp. GG7]